MKKKKKKGQGEERTEGREKGRKEGSSRGGRGAAPHPTQPLVDELVAQAGPAARCPYLYVRRGEPCRCLSPARDLGPDGQEMVCDHLSLQLWCLDPSRHPGTVRPAAADH